VKRYEGLFILKVAAYDERGKDILDLITNEITALGGKVETVQKMDKRPFTRVPDRKNSAGYYINVIFEATPEALKALPGKFSLNDDVYRVMFTEAAAAPAAA